MKIYLLDSLQELQQHLVKNFKYYQVVANQDGQYHWQEMSNDPVQPLLNEKPLSSPKGFFFSDQENILVFNGEYFQETLPTPHPFVLFGVQSCDLTAITYQDQFFKDDPYYQARRQQCLLIGLDCITPCDQGFCPTVNAGPGVKEDDADLVLHQLSNNQWLLLQQTNKGAQAIEGLTLTETHWHYLTQRDLTLHQCEQQFSDNSYISQGIKAINAGSVSNELWEKIAIQCLGCSGCTSLCPTCSCYGTRTIKQDVHPKNKTQSQPVKQHFKQQRFWDSCLYEGFQKEASFHNPSAEAGSRVQRFWQHKFGDNFASEFSRYGCVGCGRCEETCPGVIGVHSVMKRIFQENTQGEGNA
jgi:ferredoxin